MRVYFQMKLRVSIASFVGGDCNLDGPIVNICVYVCVVENTDKGGPREMKPKGFDKNRKYKVKKNYRQRSLDGFLRSVKVECSGIVASPG